MYALSDHGFAVTATLVHDGSGGLRGITDWMLRPLQNVMGRAVTTWQRDAEALVRDPDGTFVVSFEHDHRIWRYPQLSGRPQPLKPPAALSRAPRNQGVEAMTRLHDGRLMLLTEAYANDDGTYKGWFAAGEVFEPFAYQPDQNYRPTDLATLPNGDVLLLERRYHVLLGMAARLQRLERGALKARTIVNQHLPGTLLADLQAPLAIDNFEGLAVHPHPSGDIFIYLISDDNYLLFQKTILYQFRLLP